MQDEKESAEVNQHVGFGVGCHQVLGGNPEILEVLGGQLG